MSRARRASSGSYGARHGSKIPRRGGERLHHGDGTGERQVPRGARRHGPAGRPCGPGRLLPPGDCRRRQARPAHRAHARPLRPDRLLRGDARAHRGGGVAADRVGCAAGPREARRRGLPGAGGDAATSSSARGPTSPAARPASTSTSTRTSPTSSARPCSWSCAAARRARRRASYAWRASRSPTRAASCWAWSSTESRRSSSRRSAAAVAPTDGDAPVYVLAEQADLAEPTVAEVADALGATLLFGDDGMQRPVRDVRIAATSVEHFLEDFPEGALVIASGDRPDILVATLASSLSPDFPAIAGLVLTGGPSGRRRRAQAPGGRAVPGAGGARPRIHDRIGRALGAHGDHGRQRAPDRRRARRLRGRRRRGGAGRQGRRRAPRAHDADHVRVRADRARAVGPHAHRPPRGRGRARPARRGDPAAPRGRGPDDPRKRRRTCGRERTRSAWTSATAQIVDPARVAAARRVRRASTTSCASTRA